MKDEKVNANKDEFFDTQELTSDNMDGVAGGAGGYSPASEWNERCPKCREWMTLYRTEKIEHFTIRYYHCEACGASKRTAHDDSKAEIH